MKRLIAALAMSLLAAGARADELRLAVTTSFHNSGLAEVLLPEIRAELGLEVRMLVVGTGQALRLGRAGDVDAVLVHSKDAEEAFVDEGHAPHRRELMYNDFVLIGPVADAADLAASDSAADALARIASNALPFVSRGDDSGTHRRERSLWEAAGVAIADADPRWYREAGAGMGATLNLAAGMGAHTLSDRASFLNFQNKADLAILFEGDPALFNQYAYLPIDPEAHPHVAFDAAIALEDWLASETGQALIGAHQIDGQTLFTPNAQP